MKNSNRSFDVLQSLDGIKEMSLEELRDILQALNEKVKSSLALRCNYLESDFAAFLEDAASDCAFQIKKEQDQAERDRAEYDGAIGSAIGAASGAINGSTISAVAGAVVSATADSATKEAK